MKRETWAPAAVVALTILFGLVSFLVWSTRGRNAWLLRRKLAVGAVLLGLTWTAAGCGDGPSTLCYAPAPPDSVEIDGAAGSEITLAADGPRSVTGEVVRRLSDSFSFLITDEADSVRQREDIAAADGAFDSPQEAFAITIAPEIPPGDYRLSFHPVPAAEAVPMGAVEVLTLHLQAPAGAAAPEASRAAAAARPGRS